MTPSPSLTKSLSADFCHNKTSQSIKKAKSAQELLALSKASSLSTMIRSNSPSRKSKS